MLSSQQINEGSDRKNRNVFVSDLSVPDTRRERSENGGKGCKGSCTMVCILQGMEGSISSMTIQTTAAFISLFLMLLESNVK